MLFTQTIQKLKLVTQFEFTKTQILHVRNVDCFVSVLNDTIYANGVRFSFLVSTNNLYRRLAFYPYECIIKLALIISNVSGRDLGLNYHSMLVNMYMYRKLVNLVWD